jgi:hypothetical protein
MTLMRITKFNASWPQLCWVVLLVLPLGTLGCSQLSPRETDFRENTESFADEFRTSKKGLSAGLSDKARQIERNVGIP